MLYSFIIRALEAMAIIVVLAVGAATLIGVAIAIYGRVQTQDEVRRNDPPIGWFRTLFPRRESSFTSISSPFM